MTTTLPISMITRKTTNERNDNDNEYELDGGIAEGKEEEPVGGRA